MGNAIYDNRRGFTGCRPGLDILSVTGNLQNGKGILEELACLAGFVYHLGFYP